jgi:aldose 1-epimerase
MTIEQSFFGKTSRGQNVTSYRITNSRGSYITLLDYGAVLKDIVVPDREGCLTDVALGYNYISGYEDNPPHMGATIGRNCNRISSGEFSLCGKNIIFL